MEKRCTLIPETGSDLDFARSDLSSEALAKEEARGKSTGLTLSERVVTTVTMKTWIVLLAMIGPLRVITETADWHVPSAVCRFRVVKQNNSPWPATVGFVSVCAPEKNPSDCRIRVFQTNGTEVGCQVLWSCKGEPMKILFDTSSYDTHYYLYAGDEGHAEISSWRPQAGIILETRKRGKGSMDSWKQVKSLWTNSAPVLGKSIVSMIFHGIHLHGPTRDFISSYTSYFDITKEGEYSFATISTDASFLLIDGNLVAQWPGCHDINGGRRGEHHGAIRLGSGRHLIHYYHVHRTGRMAAVAAWKPPGNKQFEVIPEEVFTPVSRFQPSAFEWAETRSSQACFDWKIIGHTMVNNLAMVNVKFRALFPEAKSYTCKWTFDDGTTATGHILNHLFPRPGTRVVKLDVFSGKTRVGTLSHQVSVHPLWSQEKEWPPKRFKWQKTELLARNLFLMPIDDLTHLTKIADQIKDRSWLSQLGYACWQRRLELPPQDIHLLYKLGFHFQHHDVRDYHLAESLFRAVPKLDPTDSALTAKTNLHLAEILIHCRGNPDEALAILRNLDVYQLTVKDQHLKQLLEGDAMLAKGHAEKARIIFQTVGRNTKQDPRLQAISCRASIEIARDFLRRNELDLTAELIKTIERETPAERLSFETGGIMIEVNLARLEYPFALTRCQRLLNVPSLREQDRATLLLKLITIHLSMENRDLAETVFNKLLKEHPYSEAAARARDQFGKTFRLSS